MDSRLPDHSILREWLSLDLDGELGDLERSRLRQHLATCRECQEERRELTALDRLLTASRIPVRAHLRQDIMAGLPAAPWEARLRRSWITGLVAVLLLVVGSAVLIGLSSTDLMSAAPIAAAAAVWELLRSSALAGAGLLAASWKGLGIALQEALGRSHWNLIAFGVVVLCLNVLLLRLLRRSRAAPVESAGDELPPRLR